MVEGYTGEEDKIKGIVSRGGDTYLCLSSPLMHPLRRWVGKQIGSVGTYAVGRGGQVGTGVGQCRVRVDIRYPQIDR
jgi:hypothetical protein